MRKVISLSILMLIGVAAVFVACKKKEFKAAADIVPNDFLAATNFNELVVEISYMDGYEPNQASLDNLKEFMQARLHKPSGISFVKRSISPEGQNQYSIGDIIEIEEKRRKEFPEDEKLALHILFLDGGYTEDQGNSKVLGVQYNPTSLAIFQRTIKEFSGGIGQPSQTTLGTTVLMHELGHILGLVNNGTNMVNNHQDTAHGAHCDDNNCLMNFSVETSDFIANLSGGNIPNLDDECIADLQNNGGK